MKTNKLCPRLSFDGGEGLVGISAVLISSWISGWNQNQEQTFAFTNVNLSLMTSETAIKDQTILVRGTRIVAIGGSDTLKIPVGAQVIDDCEGVVLVKGWDGHSTAQHRLVDKP
jgi:hypothetical protein